VVVKILCLSEIHATKILVQEGMAVLDMAGMGHSAEVEGNVSWRVSWRVSGGSNIRDAGLKDLEEIVARSMT